MKRVVLNIVLSLLALLAATSCNIKEDISNCPGSMILDYSAYPEEVLDDIEDSESIDVFIFDNDDVCCDIRSFTYGELREVGFEFTLPIKYRNYNAVVWQGLNSDRYNSSTMVLGQSLEEFYMKLIYDRATDCYKGVPDPLWATPLEPIEYCAKITRHRVYMTRLHTEVYVNIQEKYDDGRYVDLDIDDYSVRIEAADNAYHIDRSIDESSIMLCYNNIGHDVGALRLTPQMNCRLVVGGMNFNIDLIEYMLATKVSDEFTDQQFLDRNKVWDINIVVKEVVGGGCIALGININGWVKWFSSEDLS